ncbi:hypothetical protein [Vibrio rotiferianus]|uniref:hypothetical protein n=1 Tax=Vibrio rotiferianus TaxID=190895 RepID=UPI00406A20B1
MNTKSLLAIAISITSLGAHASEKEQVNYGDPTASFSTLGVSTNENTTQLNGMMGLGSNIFQVDLGRDNKNGDLSYRGRYFHITDGLGYSVDVLGDEFNTTALAGVMYKFQVNPNISVFPMVSAGYSHTDFHGLKHGSVLGQAGVYAMYGFDAGHWVYANPKTTYYGEHKEFINQLEVGGGFMISDNISIGAKIDYTAKNKKFGMADNTVTWLQANYYF